jgi:hypothetical protein
VGVIVLFSTPVIVFVSSFWLVCCSMLKMRVRGHFGHHSSNPFGDIAETNSRMSSFNRALL